MLMPIILIVLLLAVAAFAIIMVMQLDKQSRSAGRRVAKSGLLSITQWLRLAKFFEDSFMTRGGFLRVKDRVALLSVYSPQEIRMQATKFYLNSLTIIIGVNIAGIVIFSDLFNCLLVFAFSVILKTTMVDKSLDKVNLRLLRQLSLCLSSVRQGYMRTGIIPDAIQEAERGPLLQRAMDDIYDILTLTQAERRLDEFIATTPCKVLKTFAGICYRSNDVGETGKVGEVSVFIQALQMISDEINLEVRKLAKQKAKFGMLEIMPIAVLPGIFIIESYFSGVIPGTSVMYNGLYGYISRLVITTLGIIGYFFITTINKSVPVAENDRTQWIEHALSNKTFAKIIHSIEPKKFRKVHKFNMQVKGALSQKSLSHVTVEKITYGAAAFVLCLVSILASINLSREYIYSNVGSLSMISDENLTQEDIEDRLEVDEEYLSYKSLPTKSWTTDYVTRKFPRLLNMQRDEQVDRLMKKYTSYHNTVWHWWELLICYAVTYVATLIPNLLFLMRAWLLKTEEEEDVLQLQTIIVILMHTPIDTLDTLEWMVRQSRIHKDALIDAYHGYPADPEFALAKLKDRSGSAEFKRMIDRLTLTIHQSTLYDAFSDLQAERTQVLQLREITQEATLAKRRRFAGWFAMAPLAALVFLHLLIPIGVIGFSEFSTALANIQQ